MSARTQNLGSIAMAQQTGLGATFLVNPADATSTADYTIATGNAYLWKFRPGVKTTPKIESEQIRQGGGGRDVNLDIREAVESGLTIPFLAHPTGLGWALAGMCGTEGLTQPATPKASGGNSTLKVALGPDSTTASLTVTVAPDTLANYSAGDVFIIGKGPTLEYFTIKAATSPAGGGTANVTFVIDCTATPLRFPHNVGEPVVETKFVGTLTSATAAAATSFPVTVIAGTIANLDKMQLGDGREWDSVEVVVASGAVSGGAFPGAAAANAHAAGVLVFTVGGSTYIHTFRPLYTDLSALKYYTFEVNYVGKNILRYADQKFGKLGISMQAKKPLVVTAELMGTQAYYRSAAIDTTGKYESALLQPFMFFNGNFSMGVGTQRQVRALTEVNFQMDNKLVSLYSNDIAPFDVVETGREFGMDFKVYFDDTDSYLLFREILHGASPAVGDPIKNINQSGSVSLSYNFTEAQDSKTRSFCQWTPRVVYEGAAEMELNPEPAPLMMALKGVPLADEGNTDAAYRNAVLFSVETLRSTKYLS